MALESECSAVADWVGCTNRVRFPANHASFGIKTLCQSIPTCRNGSQESTFTRMIPARARKVTRVLNRSKNWHIILMNLTEMIAIHTVPVGMRPACFVFYVPVANHFVVAGFSAGLRLGSAVSTRVAGSLESLVNSRSSMSSSRRQLKESDASAQKSPCRENIGGTVSPLESFRSSRRRRNMGPTKRFEM